jgi:hypothetical protein
MFLPFAPVARLALKFRPQWMPYFLTHGAVVERLGKPVEQYNEKPQPFDCG